MPKFISFLKSLQPYFFLRVMAVLFYITMPLLSGCMVGPDFHRPAKPHLQVYTKECLPAKTTSVKVHGGAAQCFVANCDIPGQWWELFHSPQLNALIARAIANNPNLKAARSALRQAEHNWQSQVGTMLSPQFSAQAYFNKQRFSATQFGATQAPGNIFTLYNAQVNVSYSLDVFGGSHRQVESYGALVDYQGFQLEAAYITLTANIVTTAILEASLRGQIEATYDLIQEQTEQLNILKKQLILGGTALPNVLAQETLLARTIATLPPLQNSLSQARHNLAVLVGEYPGQTLLPCFHLCDLHLPRRLPISIPSTLVRQRPDVLAAEAKLHQTVALIGVATANMLPQFPITGYRGTQANFFDQLFTPDALIWSITTQVTQALFQGGALVEARRAAISGAKQAAAQYCQTVLLAFKNVADSLRAIQFDAEALKAQREAEIAARNSYELAKKQFRLGGVNYLNVLDAARQYQQVRILRIQAQAARYSDTAALFQALGGGWWNRGCPLLKCGK
jgi:NodT family efflux transporter outer membrane factor (OMF) lipoprotein